MERINMSLDDIMAAKRSAPKATKANKPMPKPKVVKSAPSGVAKVRQPVRVSQNEPTVRINKPGQQSRAAENKSLSVFARMGKPPVSGTRVTFANLKSSVREEDLRELCSSMGEIKDADFTQGRGGRNSAVVLFARRSEALNCVASLNGMTLDGAPMEVSVTGEPAPEAPKSVFDRLQGVPAAKNVRQGLFGTAMDEDDDSAPARTRGGPSFSVSLSSRNNGGRPAKLVQPFSVPNENQQRPRSGSSTGRFNQHDDRVERPARQNGGQSSRGGGGGRQGGNGNGNRRGDRAGRPGKAQAPANPKDLDADLDAYFASK